MNRNQCPFDDKLYSVFIQNHNNMLSLRLCIFHHNLALILKSGHANIHNLISVINVTVQMKLSGYYGHHLAAEMCKFCLAPRQCSCAKMVFRVYEEDC